MSKNYYKCIVLLFLFVGNFAVAQQTHSAKKAAVIKEKIKSLPAVERTSYSNETGFPYAIAFKMNHAEQPKVAQSKDLIREIFSLPQTAKLVTKRKTTSIRDAKVDRFQVEYKGIKVEHGQYTVLSKNDKIISIQSEYYDLDNLNLNPSLTEAAALEYALDRIGADVYVWEQLDILINSGTFSPKQVTLFEKAKIDFFPKGELVLIKNYTNSDESLDLAYKFTVEAHEPLSKDDVYVNAHSGEIMLINAQIKHGTGHTRYAGDRTFPTTSVGTNLYELKGTDPTSGVFLDTRSLHGLGGLPLSVGALYVLSDPIQDGDALTDPCTLDDPPIAETGDDTWGTAANHEHRPALFDVNNLCCPTYTPYDPLTFSCNEVENSDVALDAHWGASVVAQYWSQIHGRNSYDGLGADILSFVHYGDAYDNAFWNGSYMTYGDGSWQGGTYPDGSFAPLSSLDVCAHEIGHAICSSTSDLVYQRESGAMNEGFSDIWAACVERYALDNIDNSIDVDPFGIGEQIDERDGGIPPGQANSKALRWMDDPKAAGDPDTYGGTNWQEPECGEPTLANDQCGVHTNSGVLNKWFYLLSTGSGLGFTPGDGKAAMDDEINDNSESYSVTAIGFGDAELITFMGEILLNPNSKFADMRAASIVAAQTLFGPCSPQEISTTNAWHAVGVGPVYTPCTTEDIKFSTFNKLIYSERNVNAGCGDSEDFTVRIYSTVLASPQTIDLTFGGTATYGTDYILSSTTENFVGSVMNLITLTIFNDKLVEGDETVTLSFDNGTFSDTYSFTIQDNDVVPVIGSGATTLLSEGFDAAGLPADWNKDFINPESGNEWFFDGTGDAAGKAYAALAAGPPAYNQSVDASVMIVSPLIDALGKSNVTVSFDHKAGGEVDVADGTLFDYGSFRYSFDGSVWTDVEHYVGSSGGNVPEAGTFSMIMPQLNNTEFYLGWRWYNDALVGSGFSFTIDNVLVTADPAQVETIINNSASANVGPNEEVYFISDQNGDVLAKIKSLGGDLGCVDVFINDNGADIVVASAGHNRSGKVLEVNSSAADTDYELTMYFKDTEVNDWASPNLLNILKVDGSNIDDSDAPTVFVPNADLTIDDQRVTNGFISYSGDFDGFSTFALTEKDPVDLFPNFTFGNLIYNIGDSRSIICNINEIENSSTLGGMEFFVPFVSGFNITFDPAQTSALIFGVPNAVDNTDWDHTIIPFVGILFNSKPGVSIPAGQRSRIAITTEAATGGAVGSITTNLTNNSGGDFNSTNNSNTVGISVQRQ